MRLFGRNKGNNSPIKLLQFILFLGIIGTTLLSVISSFGWGILLELFSHFKLQYLLLSLLILGLLVFTRKRNYIIVSIFCFSIILIEILPWYIPQTGIQGNIPINNLRVLSSNVNTQNQNYPKVLSLVRQEKPDIAVFMEVNADWIKELDSLKDILPYSVVNANPYNLGIAVYSKRQLQNASINFFGTTNNPSIVGSLIFNRKFISLIAIHPPPPFKPALFQARNKQLGEITKYVNSLSSPVVIVGDFNITMWSQYYKNFVRKTGLRNARQGFGILPTWPIKTNYPPYSRIPLPLTWLLSIPIDQCLISPSLKVASIRTGANVGSDHRPLIADLVIPETKN
jgi:endonuclease/exonuclease/phosphatase (EEP) superfamily protein YafD